MKKLLSLIIVCFAFLTQNAFAQADNVWQEEEAFHTVMSQTWHPIEKGDYAPIRARSGELSEAALAWKKSKIPSHIKATKDIKKKLKELTRETKELKKEIAKGCDDEEIRQEMDELHELFHDIVGLCRE